MDYLRGETPTRPRAVRVYRSGRAASSRVQSIRRNRSKGTAWRALVRVGAYLSQNPHSSFFYLFTGLHALHLVGGLVALGVVTLRHTPRRELVDVVGYYWHFLGALWLALFGVLHWIS